MKKIVIRFNAPVILTFALLSLLALLRGQWHYSSVYDGQVFMGCRNRLTPAGIETEALTLPPALQKLQSGVQGYPVFAQWEAVIQIIGQPAGIIPRKIGISGKLGSLGKIAVFKLGVFLFGKYERYYCYHRYYREEDGGVDDFTNLFHNQKLK